MRKVARIAGVARELCEHVIIFLFFPLFVVSSGILQKSTIRLFTPKGPKSEKTECPIAGGTWGHPAQAQGGAALPSFLFKITSWKPVMPLGNQGHY